MEHAADSPATENASAAANSQALDALRWNWDEAYAIDYDAERGWRARPRRRGGAPLTASTPEELRYAIWDDYPLWAVQRKAVRPVARKRKTRR